MLIRYSTQVLYDRLEDQNLHIASQIEQHQRELDAYFAKMAAEAKKLNDMIERIKRQEQVSDQGRSHY